MTNIDGALESSNQEVHEASTAVETAMDSLVKLKDLPTADHVQVFEDIQQVLAETLSSVDDA